MMADRFDSRRIAFGMVLQGDLDCLHNIHLSGLANERETDPGDVGFPSGVSMIMVS